MIISKFKGYKNVNPMDISLDEIVNIIRQDETVKANTMKYRYFLMNGLKADADKEKEIANTFTVAVRCEGGRKLKHVKEFTGLALGDFDHLPPEKVQDAFLRLKGDPHTVLAFITHSGQGLRIVYRYQAEGWEELGLKEKAEFYTVPYHEGMDYYEKLLGFTSDSKCNDCTRLSNIVHDPEVYYQPEAEPFVLDLKAIQKVSKRPAKSRRVCLEPAVLAAERELAEQGYVFEPGHHNDYVSRMGYLLNAFGVDYVEARDWAVEQFAQEYHDDVVAIFDSCYQKTEEHGTRKLPRKLPEYLQWASVKDIEAFLATQVKLRYNVIRRQCEVTWDLKAEKPVFLPITDRDENTLWCRLQKSGKKCHLGDIRNVMQSEYIPNFNPFEDYFQHLPEWDGKTDYIEQLANTVQVDGDREMFTCYFRKWLVGLVATLFDPEVVNHEIMVFIGKQGNFKSTFFALLLPPPLQPYFQVKMKNTHLNKDDMLTMGEKALICLEEIDDLRQSDLNQLKAMVTARNISERAAYARNKETRPHIASFCATGNNPNFLTDPTDNRRWLVFHVLDIESPYEHPFNYTGIYSQAWSLWRSGFCYWFDQLEIKDLNLRNKDFEVPCPEEELVMTYYRPSFPGGNSIFMKVSEVLERINVGLKQPLSAKKLGILMKKLGFIPVKHKHERGYLVIERSMDEIASSRKLIGQQLQQ